MAVVYAATHRNKRRVAIKMLHQAWYWLGAALEKTGDSAGARDAYGKLLARWGDAKPRSVFAERARAAMARVAQKGK
jgi:hypothetical protein